MRRHGLFPAPKKRTIAERIWDPASGRWTNIQAAPVRNKFSHPRPVIRNGIHHTFNIRASIPHPSPSSSGASTPRPVPPETDNFDTEDLYRQPPQPSIYDTSRDQLGSALTVDQAEGDDLPNIQDLRVTEVHQSLLACDPSADLNSVTECTRRYGDYK